MTGHDINGQSQRGRSHAPIVDAHDAHQRHNRACTHTDTHLLGGLRRLLAAMASDSGTAARERVRVNRRAEGPTEGRSGAGTAVAGGSAHTFTYTTRSCDATRQSSTSSDAEGMHLRNATTWRTNAAPRQRSTQRRCRDGRLHLTTRCSCAAQAVPPAAQRSGRRHGQRQVTAPRFEKQRQGSRHRRRGGSSGATLGTARATHAHHHTCRAAAGTRGVAPRQRRAHVTTHGFSILRAHWSAARSAAAECGDGGNFNRMTSEAWKHHVRASAGDACAQRRIPLTRPRFSPCSPLHLNNARAV
jgi:hypothetical protein